MKITLAQMQAAGEAQSPYLGWTATPTDILRAGRNALSAAFPDAEFDPIPDVVYTAIGVPSIGWIGHSQVNGQEKT